MFVIEGFFGVCVCVCEIVYIYVFVCLCVWWCVCVCVCVLFVCFHAFKLDCIYMSVIYKYIYFSVVAFVSQFHLFFSVD